MPPSRLVKGGVKRETSMQRYSPLAELEGRSPSRGQRGSNAEPWSYLSAEDALAGGWKNDNS